MPMSETCTTPGCSAPARIHDRDGSYCQAHWDEIEDALHAEEKQATVEAGGPWPQTCPRRYEPGQQAGAAEQDTWDVREQMHKGLRARHCSYCGSLHPDDFMRLVKDGWPVGATDKSYKAYLDSPDGGSQQTKFYFQHLSDDQKREFVELHNARRIVFAGGYGFYRLPFFMVPAAGPDR